MTEIEAIKILDFAIVNNDSILVQEASKLAIKALEEVQKYRAIGTPTQIYEKIGGLDVELGKYASIGTVEEFKALKENQRECKDCAGCTTWKCDCANIRDKAIDDFANFIQEKAKQNNGLRLSSETRSWTHASIFDYVNEFKTKQICDKE